MKHSVLKSLIYASLLCLIFSCENDPDDGLSSLINIKIESAGASCSSGGFKIETGIDLNRNGVLDSDEVQNSEFICNGNDGFDGADARMVLGETQIGFVSDSSYHANTDGFLLVQYSSKINYGSIDGKIYSDATDDPSTVVGLVNMVPGSTVIPIQENNYWKVTKVEYCTAEISWIPIK